MYGQAMERKAEKIVEPTVENKITQHQQTHKEIIIIKTVVMFNSKMENVLVIAKTAAESFAASDVNAVKAEDIPTTVERAREKRKTHFL